MKNILGSSIGDDTKVRTAAIPHKESPEPVRSLVSVRFLEDGRKFTYYNDQFALQVGDLVFVSGKRAGQLGEVEMITTKCKIKLADYERVVSKAAAIHGTYESVLDKMLGFGRDAMTPEEFRTWILPPDNKEKEEEETEDWVVIGDGYELNLSNLENAEEVNGPVLERAVDYCREGRVAYIRVCGGLGSAYIKGAKWYKVDFRLEGNNMTGMFCDCPYPGLCKHLLAVALSIRALMEKGNLEADRDFVAIDAGHFWSMAAHTGKKVSL